MSKTVHLMTVQEEPRTVAYEMIAFLGVRNESTHGVELLRVKTNQSGHREVKNYELCYRE